MKLFISHITEESVLASVLKDWIESTFAGQCTVFVSSDPQDIPAGADWLSQVEDAAETAKAVLVLCSPRSLPRPWINFEMGCAWIRKVPIIPVCHSGQTKGSLPQPISRFQALEVESGGFPEELFASLAKHLGITKIPKIDRTAMKTEIEAALKKVPPTETKPMSADTVSDSGFGEMEQNILKKMADTGDPGHEAVLLAGLFQLAVPKMQYYLDKLDEAKLVTRHFYIGRPSEYTLTRAGRSFLVERGLL